MGGGVSLNVKCIFGVDAFPMGVQKQCLRGAGAAERRKLARESRPEPPVSLAEDCICLDQPRLARKPILIGRKQLLIVSHWWRAVTCRP